VDNTLTVKFVKSGESLQRDGQDHCGFPQLFNVGLKVGIPLFQNLFKRQTCKQSKHKLQTKNERKQKGNEGK
jgi:hypothetical protein